MSIARSKSMDNLLSDGTVALLRERSAIGLLASLRRRLQDDGGRVDTQTEKGVEACSRFLQALEGAAEVLGLEPTSRAYRVGFSANYRALFEGETRSYRVDILEAGTSLVQHPVIWANGEEYELSDEAMLRSETMREAWAEVCLILEEWVTPSGSPRVPSGSNRSRLRAALDRLDIAWAGFERAYIADLMKVQERARRLVEQAVECECSLSEFESRMTKDELVELPAYQAEKRALVACIARLNSVANFQRKGRDDLPVGILDAAVELMDRCEDVEPHLAKGVSLDAARGIAEQVVESFEELRDYLHEIQHHLDLLHPHLCQNHRLVEKLVRWEETWEIGARYIHHEDVLHSLCYLVPQLQRARGAVPALAEMCEDCDAELFLVLPRIVLLCLLCDPAKAIELLRRLLPHRFGQRSVPLSTGRLRCARSSSSPDLFREAEIPLSRVEIRPCLGPELQALTEKFWRAETLLASTTPVAADGNRPSAFDVLIQRAVGGLDRKASCRSGDNVRQLGDTGVDDSACEAAAVAVDDLMHELESWSMELQRHSPEDWNECVNVLVQCMARS